MLLYAPTIRRERALRQERRRASTAAVTEADFIAADLAINYSTPIAASRTSSFWPAAICRVTSPSAHDVTMTMAVYHLATRHRVYII